MDKSTEHRNQAKRNRHNAKRRAKIKTLRAVGAHTNATAAYRQPLPTE